MTDFTQLKLHNDILTSLKAIGYAKPTMVQNKTIPYILDEKDIIVKAQTGTGKTAAFGIPLSQMVNWEENRPQALIIAPTRELAQQIREDIFQIGRYKRLKVAAIYGQVPYRPQVIELKQKTHIVVGTPGRILDHLEQGTINIDAIKYVVIDEADEMLRMGFLEQVTAILEQLPKQRTTMLFSATMDQNIANIADRYMANPISIEIESDAIAVDKIIQEAYITTEDKRLDLLMDVTIIENKDYCVIFCNTQSMVEQIYKKLLDNQYNCDRIHGGMDQKERNRVLRRVREGRVRYLIATDVAARGLDIEQLQLVINYELPRLKEYYVHRIGRTGRNNQSGRAISFVLKGQEARLLELQDYAGTNITYQDKPDRTKVKAAATEFLQKQSQQTRIENKKDSSRNQEITKIHINAGKKQKMRAVDIVGTLCNIAGMAAQDIGVIDIRDISTYVEILNHKGPIVLKALKTKPLKGRIRKVTKENQER